MLISSDDWQISVCVSKLTATQKVNLLIGLKQLFQISSKQIQKLEDKMASLLD